MTQSMVTSALEFDYNKAKDVENLLDTFRPELFNSSGKIRQALRDQGVHFLSITVVRGDDAEPTHLVIEMSGDGAPRAVFDRVARSLDPWLKQIFAAGGIAHAGALADQLAASQVKTRQDLFRTAGLEFCGTPGFTVDRITREYKLADWLRTYFDENQPTGRPVEIMHRIRERVRGEPQFAALLSAEPVPRIEADAGKKLDINFLAGLVGRAALTFFWPVLLVLAALVAVATCYSWSAGGIALAVFAFFVALIVAAGIFVAILAALYRGLRRAEEANTPIDTPVDPAVMEAVSNSENLKDTQQNHLAGVSVMQAGWLREFTLRIAFWVIREMATKRFRPGFLGDIGTIHFARWLRLPKTNKLLFFSNYGGSWESYLEDFITKASNGLTGAWSNTVGFPRTENLFFQGSTDGDRFKRWARRQQQPSRFWYSAYPHLTTARIRTNAAIRSGLATASTEDEAAAWLGLFGSAVRPPDLIETAEVQTLLYGGLSRHRYSACIAVTLPPVADKARSWLKEVTPRVTFGDEPPLDKVLILAMSATGLQRLGLPDDVYMSFPTAFRAGMNAPARANLLGDTGDDHAKHWLWGGDASPVDAVLLVYADNAATLESAVGELAAGIRSAGGSEVHTITPSPLPERKPGESGARVAYEPFGFADGISQPIIRGTRRWLRQSDAIHTVEPGEFLLGYPDGRGYFPPSPVASPSADHGNVLPLADRKQTHGLLFPAFDPQAGASLRDFGRNGTFMVVRHLTQDVDAFNAFLAEAATHYANHPAVPRELPEDLLEEWIAAKMVGRWKDGSSLVRFPHAPATRRGDSARLFRGDNEFLFGAEDPIGERCPLGSHIRRSNPRESMRPGSKEEIGIVNRHRILRLGRGFDPGGARDPQEPGKPGLLFICLNADIERQFEFIQQTWAMAWQFHGLANEVDPISGRGRKLGRLTIPSANGPLNLTGIKDWVRVRGGAYLFMPSRSALHFLINLADGP